MKPDRAELAYRVRIEAAEQARHRTHPVHEANPDEERYGFANYLMNFTKGLKHHKTLGVVEVPAHFKAFRGCIDEGFAEPFTSRVFVPATPTVDPKKDMDRRQWEAPTAGVVCDLEGPDAQAVTMAPAPELCSDELTFEMAEVYELALLRDIPITTFDQGGGTGESDLNDSIDRMNNLQYAKDGFPNRPRKTEMSGANAGKISRQTAFRGSSPGVENGPYVSQFLWMGNDTDCNKAKDGFLSYGIQKIDQRIPAAVNGDDYMQRWNDWHCVQEGFDPRKGGSGQKLDCDTCFIHRPRDLATYVHFDALYQAYLNATLILLGMKTPFDPSFAKLSGMRNMYQPGNSEGIKQSAGGFALWGGPHILTLVTEVATRALKAVRYQKFNTHLRLRPEVLAGRVARFEELEKAFPSLCGCLTKMREELDPTLEKIHQFNGADPELPNGNFLLPMAFQEGSPMHPTYGAGHATVAGACTTVVKAFFDTGTILGEKNGKAGFFNNVDQPLYFEPDKDGKKLGVKKPKTCPLTLEGELNKLAANISIGRNMAGVHYFSDYYDSLRMGEEIAIGMLREQALCYQTDEFVLTLPTFDGKQIRIGAR
ncbi:MAG: vanadium-dependent haloperoxidase [Pseudomonadota bacterium]